MDNATHLVKMLPTALKNQVKIKNKILFYLNSILFYFILF